MSYDEKDLEIARLKGQIEALERIVAAQRALVLTPSTVPFVAPSPIVLPVNPIKEPTYIGDPLPVFDVVCGGPQRISDTIRFAS